MTQNCIASVTNLQHIQKLADVFLDGNKMSNFQFSPDLIPDLKQFSIKTVINKQKNRRLMIVIQLILKHSYRLVNLIFQYWCHRWNWPLWSFGQSLPPDSQSDDQGDYEWEKSTSDIGRQTWHWTWNRAFVWLRWPIKRKPRCSSMVREVDYNKIEGTLILKLATVKSLKDNKNLSNKIG